jgi:glycosyltransferase involved in cell wall biosynthesis
MDSAVFHAKRRMRLDVDPDYDLVYEYFDVMHYLLQAQRLVHQPGIDLVEHFLRTGVDHRRSPNPNFSMESYLERYPEREHGAERSPFLEWLKRGRAAGEIADPAPAIPEMAHILGLSEQQVLDMLVDRRSDLVQRLQTGKLGEMFARATEIEPLIGRADARFTRPRLLPFGHPPALLQAAVIQAAHEAAGFRGARLVLVVNRARWGGGRRMEGHIAHAAATRVDPEEIVVIYTDGGGSAPAGRFPTGVREIDFAGLAERLEPEDAETALVVLIRTFRADAVVNFNSATLYQAMQSYGRALAASERLFPCFFCNEQTFTGAWTGWSLRYFYRTFDIAAGVITDSQYLADQLTAAYKLGGTNRERLHVFQAPVDAGLPVMTEPASATGRRHQIFWAGRWDRQKRIGLLRAIARRMPDVDFRVWGEPVMGGGAIRMPPNVTVEGRYGHISEIPLSDADAWLYTSRWDGVPSQLLEVAMTGIPIVGTLVGGTGEVISEEDAWPVSDHAAADVYEQAIRTVLADPAAARRRALALRERMLRERTEKALVDQVIDVLLCDEETERGKDERH